MIKEQIKTRPTIVFTYFIPDLKKDGGKYVTVTGIVRKIDEYRQIIILEDKTEIPINEIISITQHLFLPTKTLINIIFYQKDTDD